MKDILLSDNSMAPVEIYQNQARTRSFYKKQSTQLLHCQLLSHIELHIDSIRMTNIIFQQLGFPPR